MSKQDALIYARQLEVDRFVRKLAYTGHSDEAGLNFWYDWMDGETHVEVRASNAGVYSAAVGIKDGAMLYHATDCGRIIDTYRHGQWVHRLRELADSEHEADQRRRQAEIELRLAAEAYNFSPIDF
jgi:hypothetical protein